jgi:hypothetical protein
MSEEHPGRHPPHKEDANQRNHPRDHKSRERRRLMHIHALAFNTLLSSQETDAYTTRNQTHQGPDPDQGVHFVFLNFTSFRRSPSNQPICRNRLQLLKSWSPRRQGNPSNLRHHPRQVQSSQIAARVDLVRATHQSRTLRRGRSFRDRVVRDAPGVRRLCGRPAVSLGWNRTLSRSGGSVKSITGTIAQLIP